ncbi:MAG: hypothetical protein ACE5GK_00255 [Nitrospiria bacterium]
MHRLPDAGAHWEEIAAPAYPPGTPETEDDGSVKLLWCLAAGRFNQAGWLWAGTIPGGLFCSNDFGNSWNLVDALWSLTDRREWQGGGYTISPVSIRFVSIPAMADISSWYLRRRDLAKHG